jgi:hypothetical protein
MKNKENTLQRANDRKKGLGCWGCVGVDAPARYLPR